MSFETMPDKMERVEPAALSGIDSWKSNSGSGNSQELYRCSPAVRGKTDLRKVDSMS
jgi:hypothetical protein